MVVSAGTMQLTFSIAIMQVLMFYWNYVGGTFCDTYVGGSFCCSYDSAANKQILLAQWKCENCES